MSFSPAVVAAAVAALVARHGRALGLRIAALDAQVWAEAGAADTAAHYRAAIALH